jgi:ElaB/YqjD/DUF883 family membrane-anchored ribosome-binding protein
MVNEMIERVQKHEDIFDNMNDPEKEKVQKMRDTIKSKVETELQKMKREVNSLLKVNSMNSSNMMDNLTEMMDRVNSMMSNL